MFLKGLLPSSVDPTAAMATLSEVSFRFTFTLPLPPRGFRGLASAPIAPAPIPVPAESAPAPAPAYKLIVMRCSGVVPRTGENAAELLLFPPRLRPPGDKICSSE